jgi:hypothetical protein
MLCALFIFKIDYAFKYTQEHKRLGYSMHADGVFFSENNPCTCMEQPGLGNTFLLLVILKIINLLQEQVCKYLKKTYVIDLE